MTNDDRILVMLGEVRGETRAMRTEIAGVGRQLELNRQALEQQGVKIAALPCAARGKQISDLFHAIGQVKEDTGVIEVGLLEQQVKEKTTRQLMRAGWIAARVLLAILATLGVGGGLLAAIQAAMR